MNWLLVFIGGGLGSVARLGLARLFPPLALKAGGFPWATFSANLLACTLLGLGLSLATKSHLTAAQQFFALTGFCGGFSTFSTFAAEAVVLLQEGYPGSALAYVAASIACGTLAIYGALYLTVATG